MSKRPLWTAFLLWAIFLALTGNGGSQKENPPPSWMKEGTALELEGRVYQQEWKEKTILLYLNQVKVKSESDFEFSENVAISTKEKKEWTVGTRVRVSGTAEEWEEASNWGGFDQKSYYEQQGIGLFLQNCKVSSMKKADGSYATILEQGRQIFAKSIDRISTQADSAVLKAMILGKKEELTREQKGIYEKGGISHILAISGLHISFLGLLFYRFLRNRGISFRIAGVLAGGVIGSYGIMTGMSVSAMRAVVMFLVYLGAEMSGQTYDILSALSFAGLVLLVQNPDNLRQASFLLSFGAVLGLTLLLPKMEEVFQREKEHSAWKVLRASVCVSLATLPITLVFFYEWSVFGILLNLLVLPTVQFVLLSGIAGMTAGLFCGSLGTLLAAPAHYLLLIYEEAAKLSAEIPFGIWRPGCPSSEQIVLYYGFLFGIGFLGCHLPKKGKKLVWMIGILCLFCVIGKLPDQRLCVTFLDVGQGDGICIQNGTNGCYMIDGGSTSEGALGEFCLEPYLKFEGISKIEGWFITHTDLDHISGLLEILQSYRTTWDGRNAEGVSVKRIFLPYRENKTLSYEQLEKLAKKNKIALYYIEKGQKIKEGKMELQCLAPERGALSGEENSDSMVLSLQYGDFTGLFTGDLEGEGEKALVQGGLLEETQLLKVAHHGSGFSTTEEFLEQTKPQIAVISCAERNSYGHPHPELILRLQKAGSLIKMTKECGAVKIVTDGKQYQITQKKRGEV